MFKRRPLGANRSDQSTGPGTGQNAGENSNENQTPKSETESGGFSQATGGARPAATQTNQSASQGGGQSSRPATNSSAAGQASPTGNRVAGTNTQPSGQNRPHNPRPQRAANAQGQNQGQGQGQQNRRPRQQNNRNQNAGQNGRPAGGQQQPQQQGGRGPQGNNRPQQNQQQNRGGSRNQSQQQNQNRNNRTRPEPRRAPPPPPPAYIQRDVLLIPQSGSVEGIELVRAKFDPLAKKIPAHVTLVFPESAEIIGKDFLKEFSRGELPALDSITFSSVIVHEDMYLWLVPDDETKQKLVLWREALLKKLGEHKQSDEFVPHLTLGYIPRSITPEDALTFAKTHVSLPLTLPLDKILLEEFPESQVSTQVDTFLLNAQESQ